MKLRELIFGKENPDNFFVYGVFNKPFYALILSAIIPTFHVYFGSKAFFTKNFSHLIENPYFQDYFSVIYLFVSAMILMGIVPALFIKLLFKEKLSDYGLVIGDWKLGIKSILILFPIILIFFLLPAAYQKEIKEFYPLFRPALNDLTTLINIEILRGIIYYSAWEFFFRGFMIFSLRQYVGDWLAILIQTIPSCLWHIGYPTGEIIMSIPAGIMFGIIAVRTKSILYPFLLHWLIGFSTSLLVYLTN